MTSVGRCEASGYMQDVYKPKRAGPAAQGLHALTALTSSCSAPNFDLQA